jgi:hypothetical protein
MEDGFGRVPQTDGRFGNYGSGGSLVTAQECVIAVYVSMAHHSIQGHSQSRAPEACGGWTLDR